MAAQKSFSKEKKNSEGTCIERASLVAQMIKNLPAMKET